MGKVRKEYIPMSNANVKYEAVNGGTDIWTIRENITGNVLGVINANIPDSEMFSILHLIQKYEEDAFNVGIEFGKQKYKNVFDPQMAQLKEINRLAGIENERLADALENEQNKININK